MAQIALHYIALHYRIVCTRSCDENSEKQRASSGRERGRAELEKWRSFRNRTKCVYILINLSIVGPSFARIRSCVVLLSYALLLL